ncbi:MAG: hypothetical protein ABI193_06590 [Minicystis sp.]
MIALCDLGLFVIDPTAWYEDREVYAAPIGALALHDRFLRAHPIALLWSDELFNGFPWNQPTCPPALREVCILVSSLHDYLKGNGRILNADDLPQAPEIVPVLEPDLLMDEEYPDDVRVAWVSLLGAIVPEEARWAKGVALPTWERPSLGKARELRITLGAEPPLVRAAALLTGEADWGTFLERFHRPDLRGKRVAVLGGHRPPFERARESLSSYGLTELRRIPPVSERNRTAQDLRQSVSSVDLLVVCTSYLGHTDTAQLDGIKDELSCAIVRLHADSDAQITKTVADHFRALPKPS